MSCQNPDELISLNLDALHFRYPEYSLFSIDKRASSLAREVILTRDVFPHETSRAIHCFFIHDCMALPSLYAAVAGITETGLCLIEPDLASVANAFSAYDFREHILSPFVFWLIGPDWKCKLHDLIHERMLFTLSPSAFHFVEPPQSTSPCHFLIQQTKETLLEAGKKERSLYIQHTKQFFSVRPENKKHGLRIWAHVEPKAPIYAGLIHSWRNAFQQLGCETVVSSYHPGWRKQEKIQSEFFHFRPDCLFLLNGPSASTLQYLGFSAGMETGIPSRRLTWYVDDPNYLATRAGNWACYQKDDVAVADRTYVTAFSHPQPRSLFHLPPAAMLESKGRFDPDLHFPILYVGSIMNLQETLSHLPMAVQTLIQDIVRAREAKKEVSFLAWMHEMNPNAQKQKALAEIAQRIVQERTAKRFSRPEQYVDYFFYLVATFYKRWNVVKTLLPLGLHVFGPNDWIPLLGDAYRDRHHGILDASELANAYASAKININLHSLQCPTSLNIRDFDIPRAGGFLLTDWVDDLEGGYVNHKEHVCAVANCEEFAAQADYYLAHENERGEIAQTGCDWVANHHTFRQRAQAVLHRLQGGA